MENQKRKKTQDKTRKRTKQEKNKILARNRDQLKGAF